MPHGPAFKDVAHDPSGDGVMGAIAMAVGGREERGPVGMVPALSGKWPDYEKS